MEDDYEGSEYEYYDEEEEEGSDEIDYANLNHEVTNANHIQRTAERQRQRRQEEERRRRML